MSAKRKIGLGVKFLVIVLLAWVLFRQVRNAENQELWIVFTSNFNPGNLSYLLVAISLMFINWGIEALKWKSIVYKFKELNYREAWNGVLMGVCLSLLTPMRIGDYMGRIIALPKEDSGKGVVANFLLSLVQNLVHIGIGILAFLLYLNQFREHDLLPNSIILAVSFSIIAVLLYLYFKPSVLSTIFLKEFWPYWIRRMGKYFEFLNDVSNKKLTHLLVFSLIRYLVFIVQYYCLILYFGLDISAFQIGIGIASIYLIQSVIPLPALVGFIARAEIAILIWGVFTDNIFGILAASYGVWVINQIFPAIMGLYYFLKADINIPLSPFTKKLNPTILGQNDSSPEL